MKLSHPFQISARLLPSLVVSGATLQLEHVGWTRDNRARFRWTIDFSAGGSCTGDDLKSGVGGCDLQEAFASLLSFLSACGESWQHSGVDGENSDLFPPEVADWAAQNSDELSMLACEIEENAGLIS